MQHYNLQRQATAAIACILSWETQTPGHTFQAPPPRTAFIALCSPLPLPLPLPALSPFLLVLNPSRRSTILVLYTF
jgi:hypothetical protein